MPPAIGAAAVGSQDVPPVATFVEHRHRKWCMMDLWTDGVTGKLRLDPILHTAAGVSIIAAYWKFVTEQSFETMSFVVGGLFISSNIANRMLNMKQQKDNPQIVPTNAKAP